MSLIAVVLVSLELSIGLSVLTLGLNATMSDATYLFRRPRELGRAFLSMNILMPLLALIILPHVSLSPPVKLAIVALSVSPVPPEFPKKALKAGGRGDYTLGLLVAAALLSIVVVPLTMEIMEAVVHIPLQMPVRDVALLVFNTILAPLLVGIGLRGFAPSFASRIEKPVATVASVLLIASAIPVLFAMTRPMLSLIGNGTILALAGFAIAGLMIGRLLGGSDPEKRQVLSLATATRHPGMAVAISHANFPAQKLALPAIVLYMIIAGIVSAVLDRRARAAKVSENENRTAA